MHSLMNRNPQLIRTLKCSSGTWDSYLPPKTLIRKCSGSHEMSSLCRSTPFSFITQCIKCSLRGKVTLHSATLWRRMSLFRAPQRWHILMFLSGITVHIWDMYRANLSWNLLFGNVHSIHGLTEVCICLNLTSSLSLDPLICQASTCLSKIALRTVFRHTHFPINRESLLNVFSIVCKLYRHSNLHISGMKPDATRFSSVINKNRRRKKDLTRYIVFR